MYKIKNVFKVFIALIALSTAGHSYQFIDYRTSTGGGGAGTAGADGKSAYQIAVDNGFVGTEVEWLASLGNTTVTETLTSIQKVGNELRYTDEEGTVKVLDLSQYEDDTNLARLVDGTLDNTTGIATFTRDDSTTFTVNMSALFDDTKVTVIDDLSSDSTTDALSAGQGKVLDLKVSNKVDTVDKATAQNLTDGDADKWVDANGLKSTIDPLKIENEALRNLMKSLGWIRNPNDFIKYGGIKAITTSDTTYTRVNSLGVIESNTFTGVTDHPFRVVDRNGYVTTGLNGDDLSVPKVNISTLWGYDKDGVLSSITAARSDGNDGVPYRYYQHPVNGDIVVLLPQYVETAVGSVQNYSDMRGIVKPTLLADYIYLGYALLDENAPDFEYSFQDVLNTDKGLYQ